MECVEHTQIPIVRHAFVQSYSAKVTCLLNQPAVAALTLLSLTGGKPIPKPYIGVVGSPSPVLIFNTAIKKVGEMFSP